MGIHEKYMASDQFEWLHKCQHCGKYNLLSYDDYDSSSADAGGNVLCLNPDGIDMLAQTVAEGTFQYVCKYCGKPIDRWYNGSWVSRYPDRTSGLDGIRGYRISQMNAVWVGIDQLKASELKSKSKQAFYNYNLGMPFTDVKLQVVPDDILKDASTDKQLPKPATTREQFAMVSMGIDWGEQYHSIVFQGLYPDGSISVCRMATVKNPGPTNVIGIDADIQEIRMMIKQMGVDIVVADTGDSGNRIAQLIESVPEIPIYGCTYSSNPTSGLATATGQINPVWNEKGYRVTVDKLTQNKRYISLMKTGMIKFYGERDKLKNLLVEHWGNVVIRDEEQANGEMRQVITRKGPDHLAQSSILSLIGIDHLRELKRDENPYGFNFDQVSMKMDDLNKPTPPDIQKQLDNHNLFN